MSWAPRPGWQWLGGRLAAGVVPVLPAIIALIAGRMIGGSFGGVVSGLLVVVGAPVLIFTRNQMVLTDSGRKLATTVAEVTSLKDADAAAFTKPLAVATAVVMRRYDTRRYGTRRHGTRRYGSRRPARARTRARVARVARPSWRAMTADPAVTFWASLTHDERVSLHAIACNRTFPAGRALFHQADPARHIYIIRTGRIQISVTDGAGGRQIATRGPGDVVGERAALQVQPRSASGVALTRVRALVVATADFAEFLRRYPRVLDVLERQVYERLTEDRLPVIRRRARSRPAAPSVPPVPSVPSVPAPAEARSARWTGQNCTIFFADVASFSGRGRIDPDRLVIRDVLYAMLRDAFDYSGVGWSECHHEDRGDGVLVIVPPGTATSLLADPLTTRLADSLACHNSVADDPAKIQLRMALHVGPVVSDAEGVSGESIIQAARILEAPVLKRELARTGADLGIIVSGFVHETVIRHLRAGEHTYQRVRVKVKESSLMAWMSLAGPSGPSVSTVPTLLDGMSAESVAASVGATVGEWTGCGT
jgi:CRP-like cAMP-binding protein